MHSCPPLEQNYRRFAPSVTLPYGDANSRDVYGCDRSSAIFFHESRPRLQYVCTLFFHYRVYAGRTSGPVPHCQHDNSRRFVFGSSIALTITLHNSCRKIKKTARKLLDCHRNRAEGGRGWGEGRGSLARVNPPAKTKIPPKKHDPLMVALAVFLAWGALYLYITKVPR